MAGDTFHSVALAHQGWLVPRFPPLGATFAVCAHFRTGRPSPNALKEEKTGKKEGRKEREAKGRKEGRKKTMEGRKGKWKGRERQRREGKALFPPPGTA